MLNPPGNCYLSYVEAAGPSTLSFLQSYLLWGLRSHDPIFGVDVEIRTAGTCCLGGGYLCCIYSQAFVIPGRGVIECKKVVHANRQVRRTYCFRKATAGGGPRLKKSFCERYQLRDSPMGAVEST